MAERLLHVTAYVLCQFLLVLLMPVAMLLSVISGLFRQLQRDLEQAVEAPVLGVPTQSKPVHVHYELHQHVHVERPSAYEQTLDQVSRHLPRSLQQIRTLPVLSEPARQSVVVDVQPREVRACRPYSSYERQAMGAYRDCRR